MVVVVIILSLYHDDVGMTQGGYLRRLSLLEEASTSRRLVKRGPWLALISQATVLWRQISHHGKREVVPQSRHGIPSLSTPRLLTAVTHRPNFDAWEVRTRAWMDPEMVETTRHQWIR